MLLVLETTCRSQGVKLITTSCIRRCSGADLLQQARHEEVPLCHTAGAAAEPSPVIPLGRPHLQAGVMCLLKCRQDMETRSVP